METVFLRLSKSVLEKTKKEAEEQAIAEMGEEDAKDELIYPDLPLELSDVSFEDGTLTIGGSIGELGYVHISYNMEIDIVIEITKEYVQKLNRLKTVLEAVKKE